MPWTDKPSGGSNNPGPWGRPQNNSGSNGQGGGAGPRGRGQGTPDLEELLRSGRERFGRGGGGRGGGTGEPLQLPSGPVAAIAVIAVLAIYLFVAAYTVQPGSRGVVTTFGNFSALTNPGLNFHFPPIQSVEIVDVEGDRSRSIGSGSRGTSMLTSDLNIVDVSLDVNFQVKSDATWSPDSGELPNAAKFIFNIESPELTVEAAAEAALREVVGANEFAPIVSRGRAVVQQRTAEILQQTLDSYDSGIRVIRINFGNATPPEPVVPAQRDVIDATSQAEQLVNEAQAIANSIVPRAEGVAFQTVQQAEAYAAQVVAEANGDSARFISILEEYSKAPDVTRQRMYIETLESVLGDMNKILIDDKAGSTLPYLNLNELARDSQRANEQRQQQRQQQNSGGGQ